MAKRGRPSGLLINPDAAHHMLKGRPQAWLAEQAGVSTAHLSDVLQGAKRAGDELADRLADALECEPGVIFPERAGFQVTVFTVAGQDAR
jgi:lambda repressor-like predicted transcriptional regulator